MAVLIQCPSCGFQASVPEPMVPQYTHCQHCRRPLNAPEGLTQAATVNLPGPNIPSPRVALPANSKAPLDFKSQFEKDPLFSPHAELAFEDLGKLGEGGMGVVRKIRDKRLGRLAALKIMLSEKKADDRTEKRFIREAEITATLNHPSIPPVYEAGRTESGSLYLLMKLIDGQTLKELIEDYHDSGRDPETLKGLIEALARACEAIAYAHEQGILHRDLKSENIMVGAFGEVLVMDWGLAKDIKDQDEIPELTDLSLISEEQGQQSGLTLEGSVLGTPGYMSPEQANGSVLDERSDLFSLGAILCEILCGETPIRGGTLVEVIVATISGHFTTPKDILRSVSSELNSLTVHALALEKEDRPQTVLAFQSDLKAWLQGQPLDSHRYSLREGTLRLARKHVGLLISSLAFLFILIVALFFLNERLQQERIVDAARRVQTSQKLFNKAKNQARRKLDSRTIKETVTDALTYAGRSEDAMLAAAEVYDLAGFDDDQEVILKQCIALHPPSYQARFRLHLLKCKSVQSQAFIMTDVLRDLFKVAEERGDENEFTLYGKGKEAAEKADYKKAIEYFNRIEKYTLAFHQAYLDRGRAWAALKDYKNALSDYDQAIRVKPDYSAAYNNRATIKIELGDKAGALDDYNRALFLDPSNAFAYSNRGLLRQTMTDVRGAIKDFQRALQIYGDGVQQKEILLNRGSAYLELGRPQKALADFSAVLTIDPQNYEAQTMRGEVFFQQRKFRDAIHEFNQAILHAPKRAKAYQGRANALSELKQDQKAIEDYSRCIANDPQSWRAYYNRGNSYTILQQYEKAKADFEQCLRLNPSYASAYFNRARINMKLGQLNDAMKDLNLAIQYNPKHSVALSNRGTLFAQMKQFKKALKDYDAAISSDPKNDDAHFNRGLIFFRQKNYSQALNALNEAIRIKRTDSEYFFLRGQSYLKLGNQNAALNDYNSAVRLNPKNAKYFNSRAFLLSSIGQKSAAYRDYSQSLRFARTPYAQAKALNNRGNILFYQASSSGQVKDYQAAFKDFNSAIKTYPKLAEAHYGRGQVYFELKKYREALVDYNNALALGLNDSQLLVRRAFCYEALGQKVAAIKAYQLYLKTAPKPELAGGQEQRVLAKIRALQGR